MLAFLRSPSYDFPLQFKDELDFYGIDNNLAEYEDEMTKLTAKLTMREDQIAKLTNKLKAREIELNDFTNRAVHIKDIARKNG